MNDSQDISIGDLAERSGLSRRAIRFYVQRGLLPPPAGRGRGASYSPAHLERLDTISRLQNAGHPLETIKALLDGELSEAQALAERRPVSPGNRSRGVSVGRWLRLEIQGGVEIHIDADRHRLDTEELLELQAALARILARRDAHSTDERDRGDD